VAIAATVVDFRRSNTTCQQPPVHDRGLFAFGPLPKASKISVFFVKNPKTPNLPKNILAQ
jgi:hypothetical protein